MPNKSQFSGFDVTKSVLIHIPYDFINELLPTIDDVDELRLTLVLFSFLLQQEGSERYISHETICENGLFTKQFSGDLQRLEIALEKCVARKTLLKFPATGVNEPRDVFFINTAQNQAIVKRLITGDVRLTDLAMASGINEKPNIFRMYEENIGVITPMLAEILKEDEQSFPSAWIADAIKIAVQHNARNWKYIHAILVSWQKEGRDGKNGQNTKKNRRKYQESWLGEKGKNN